MRCVEGRYGLLLRVFERFLEGLFRVADYLRVCLASVFAHTLGVFDGLVGVCVCVGVFSCLVCVGAGLSGAFWEGVLYGCFVDCSVE